MGACDEPSNHTDVRRSRAGILHRLHGAAAILEPAHGGFVPGHLRTVAALCRGQAAPASPRDDDWPSQCPVPGRLPGSPGGSATQLRAKSQCSIGRGTGVPEVRRSPWRQHHRYRRLPTTSTAHPSPRLSLSGRSGGQRQKSRQSRAAGNQNRALKARKQRFLGTVHTNRRCDRPTEENRVIDFG